MCYPSIISLCVLLVVLLMRSTTHARENAQKREDVPPLLSPVNPFVLGPYRSRSCSLCIPLDDGGGTCRPALVFVPEVNDKQVLFPIVLFHHGFVIPNDFYSSLLAHVASWGFIVVAPQLYEIPWNAPLGVIGAVEEIRRAKAVIAWCQLHLSDTLKEKLTDLAVVADPRNTIVVGHSRGGKVAAALAIAGGNTVGSINLNNHEDQNDESCAAESLYPHPLAAVALLDPVDGKAPPGKCCENGCITDPPLTNQASLDFGIPTLVLGTGLGPLKNWGVGCPLCICPCAPRMLGHERFYKLAANDGTNTGKYHVTVHDYGHLDLLDTGKNNQATLACKGGGSRVPLRIFSGGLVVAFLRTRVLHDPAFESELLALLMAPQEAPVENIKNVTADWKSA
jgi:chlorophyllase